MARSRNLKPGFFKNDELGECSIHARVLFAGLWCEADPRGILEDRPKRLKVEILPYDSCDVDSLLKELAEHNFIERYNCNGLNCIRVVNFRKHQNPHQNEKNSELPNPPLSTPVQVPELHQSDPEDSLLISPSTLIPSSLIPQTPKPPRGPRVVQECAEFVDFYNAYPRHQARDDAWNAWKKLNPSEQLVGDIMSGLAAMLPEFQSRPPDKVPLPATFLNGGRWKDTPVPVGMPNGRTSPNGRMSSDEIMAEAIAINEGRPKPDNVIEANFQIGGRM